MRVSRELPGHTGERLSLLPSRGRTHGQVCPFGWLEEEGSGNDSDFFKSHVMMAALCCSLGLWIPLGAYSSLSMRLPL